MNLRNKKRITASLFNVGKKRIWIDPTKSKEVKEAITKRDIKHLIKEGIIILKQKHGQSRGRIRKANMQFSKGRGKGIGSRRGASNARLSKKLQWMIKIRNQKNLLKSLRDKSLITRKNYRILFRKAKGGFFRSKRHIEIYLAEHKLIQNDNK
ncbi:MAG: 50S ribosomal protein L19e [Nanoarchaeota archaeon]